MLTPLLFAYCQELVLPRSWSCHGPWTQLNDLSISNVIISYDGPVAKIQLPALSQTHKFPKSEVNNLKSDVLQTFGRRKERICSCSIKKVTFPSFCTCTYAWAMIVQHLDTWRHCLEPATSANLLEKAHTRGTVLHAYSYFEIELVYKLLSAKSCAHPTPVQNVRIRENCHLSGWPAQFDCVLFHH